MIDTILLNIKNIPGPRLNRKIVVIECDDWGSIRMPSNQVFRTLSENGIIKGENRYSRFDTLADKTDLENLFNVLLSVRDDAGSHPVITAFTVVANPDFHKIKESGFQYYYYEPFTQTIKKYNRNPHTFDTWLEGMNLGIFIPEYHGRDHIAVGFWLKKLREGDKDLRFAFNNEVVSVKVSNLKKEISDFRPEFYFNSHDQINYLKSAIDDGVNLFKKIFGYTPRVFAPSNGIFHPLLEKTVVDAGIKYLYVNYISRIPGKNGSIRLKYYRPWTKTAFDLTYYTRNCAFEPTSPSYEGVGLTLKQIEAAFRWGKPAVISTHRVNYVGGLDKANGDKGLKELGLLLGTIINLWPSVEFMSSEKMLQTLCNK